jgi:hypothetical protein
VSSIVQFFGSGDENANPGREGTITSNETNSPFESSELCVKASMIGTNSRNDPGQPWLRIRGMAFGDLDFAWIKCIVIFSISAVK